MKIKFWGVRGSIAAPGKDTVRYGGNTLCTEVREGDTEIILDAGTGIRALGNDLIKRFGPNGINAHLFLSHTHWDHIQGFPFFAPAYIPGNKIDICAAEKVDTSLEQTLAGQMLYQYFPISLKQLGASIQFHDLKEGQTFEIVGQKPYMHPINVKNIKLNHPFPGVFAYRIDGLGFVDSVLKNESLVYATDTEHYDCLDHRLVKLAEGADVLIYDSQYTPKEYETKLSWGHSTGQKGVETAKAAHVKRLVLYHHDPTHTDDDIDKILSICQKMAGKDLEVIAASEGLEIDA